LIMLKKYIYNSAWYQQYVSSTVLPLYYNYKMTHLQSYQYVSSTGHIDSSTILFLKK
jgi:hypothetical protein